MADTPAMPKELHVSADSPRQFEAWGLDEDDRPIAYYSWPVEVTPGVWALTTGFTRSIVADGFPIPPVPPPASWR